MPRLGKTLPPPKRGHDVLTIVGQRPKIRTSSFAVSHTHLAALPWGLRLAIGRGRRGPHRRKSGLDSHLRWRLGKGPSLEKRLPDTQHRVGFARCCREDRFDPFMAHHRTHQTRMVLWVFGISFVRTDPLEANWVASVPVPPLQWRTRTPPCPTTTFFPSHGQFLTSRGSNGPSLTSSSASHSSGSFS